MMMNGVGVGMGGGGPMPPRLTTRAFEVNPSPNEIAIGSLEQWRRSKMQMVWKNVIVSLVKGAGGNQGNGSLCVWRDAISPTGSSFMELLQRVPFRDIQHIHEDNGILRISLYYSSEEPLTFRSMMEPTAIQDWVTTLRTVCQIVQTQQRQRAHSPRAPAAAPRPAQAQKPAVDLLSYDLAHSQSTPDLLMGNHGHPPPQRPVHYQTYPAGGGNAAFPQAGHPQQQPNMFAAHVQPPAQNNGFGQQPAYGNYQQAPRSGGGYPMQQPTQTQPQFSQPPPLPFAGQRSVAQAGVYNPQQARARSISPVPGGGTFRGKSPARNPAAAQAQAQQSAASKKPATNVTKNYTKAQPLQPAHKSIPRPNPNANHNRNRTKQTPRRSLSAPMSPARPKTTIGGTKGPVSYEELKKHIISTWALEPPRNIKLKPLLELIRTIQMVFPPRLRMIENHDYFDKWQPITPGEYHQQGGINKILKRVRFFLHPDKLPQDFTPDQILLCKLLWDIINDAQQNQMPR